jgi:hypothetical protein
VPLLKFQNISVSFQYKDCGKGIKRYSCACPCYEGIDRGTGIAALILNIGTRWKQSVNFMSKVHYSWERTLVPTEWKARWAAELVWTMWRTENLLPLLGFKHWIIQSVV